MNATTPRSTFVNVVGWIFLTFSAFGFLVSVLQNIMLHTVFPPDMFDQAALAPDAGNMPIFGLWMIQNMPLLFALMLVVTLVEVVASIGLLRRCNWARLLFIGLMAFGIASTLGGLVFQVVMMSDMHAQFSQLHSSRPDHMPDMGLFFIGMGVFSLAMALAFTALYAWIIKRLMGPEVVAEFMG